MRKKTRTSQTLLVGALFAALALVSTTDDAQAEGPRRVVVAKFDGPKQDASEFRKAVLEVLEDFYDVVPYRKYRIERRRMGARKSSRKKTIAKVARRLGCDAIVYGQLEDGRAIVKVREGGSGVLVGKFRVRLGEDLEVLENELTDLIDATEPVDTEIDTLEEQFAEAKATRVAAVEKPAAAPSVADAWEAKLDKDAKPKKPSPIALHAGIGVGGTARSLEFAYQGGLTDDQKPQSMAGSPALGVAFSGTADIKALGVSARGHYERSVGASLSVRDADGSKRIGMSQKHWGIGVLVRRPLGRMTVHGGAGYHQLGFSLSNKPAGLRLHDTRYSYVDIGGGARLGLRDDRVHVTVDAAYIHVLAMAGITDPSAYGTGRAQGYRTEFGFELDASESTFVRVALRYSRLVIAFDGTGELATDLDDSMDIDVSGAADTYVGGAALMGFHF